MPENEKTTKRPPIIVVVGHIDHGKSSLLEAIREDFKITQKESGGITQHLGAYEAEYKGQKMTFLDTPGHEAFSAMRSRGTVAADIAVLVVDAAEGVKDQTEEAVKFIKQSEIPMVIALNKIDKPQAVPEKVINELAKIDVVTEKLGGKIPAVKVSAKTKQGLEDLLETILLIAEMENFKADISSSARGIVLESWLDPKMGPMATLLVKNGILKQGDIVGTRSTAGKIKLIKDFQRQNIKEAYPSQPVSVLGFSKPPIAGDDFKVFPTLEEANEKIEKNLKKKAAAVILDSDRKVLNIILKTDVVGSGEALEEVLEDLPQEKVVLRILENKVGDIDFSDIKLAESGKAKIFGFRVKIDDKTKLFAQQRKVSYKIFNVIYDIIQEVRREMINISGMETKREDLGKMKILVLFKKSKDGQIVGGRIIEGKIENKCLLEVERGEEIIGKGFVKSLQQDKKDIPEAGKGKEVGILFKGDVELEEGDILHVYKEEKIRAGL